MRAYLEAARRNRKLQRIAFTAAVFAAVFVVFGVFWALKNTGIAMTGDPTCGFAEHTHTDACYEQTLVCGQEESAGHTHSVANGCYASAGAAATNGTAAPAADGAAAEQTLTCTTPEAPAHTHTQACYEQTLTCTTPEHTHSESCYGDADADVETAEDWEATLPSTLTNKWPADVVAVAQSQLDYAESTTNVTTDDNGDQKGYTRYGAWSNDPYADWSVPFAAFCLHYADADDYPAEQTAPAWAETLHRDDYKLYHSVESGYAPKPGDVVFLRADEHKEDAEKVATARAKAAEALAQAEEAAAQDAEATQDEAAQDAGADAGAEAEASAPEAAQASAPEAAQQARIEAAYADVAALADHVGIVEEVLPADQNNPERIRVIEGDSDNKVQRVDYERSADRTDERILGYAELPEDAEALQDIVDANRAAAGATQNESEAQDQPENQITQTFEGEGYTVKASYGPEAQLPEGAELRATEYAKSSRDYQDYYAEAAAQYGWEDDRSDSLRLFDVGFYVGDQEVEPAAPVKVTITYAGQQQEVNYEIIHFGDELETVETQTTTNDNSQDISFTVDSFSVFGVSPLQAPEADKLDGKTFALISSDGSKLAMLPESYRSYYLKGVQVSYNPNENDGHISPESENATRVVWTFQSVPNGESNQYYVYAETNNDTKYLKIGNSSLTLSTDQQKVTVETGTGDHAGQIRLVQDHYGYRYAAYKTANGYFGGFGARGDKDEYFYLADIKEPEAEAPETPGATTDQITAHPAPDINQSKKINHLSTDTDGNNLYRLYLDAQVIEPTKTPTDLLVIIDQSSSMQYGIDHPRYTINDSYKPREELVYEALFGTGDDGLIRQFLADGSTNQKPNKVAIMGFSGSANTAETKEILPWTSQNSSVSADKVNHSEYSGATNYCAAFSLASQMLADVADDGNRKVVLFLSDGVPTYAVYEGTRYGNGDEPPSKDVTNFTDKAYQDFLKANPDVVFNTFSVTTNEDANDRLHNMATQSGGKFLKAESNSQVQEFMNELMRGATNCKALKIEDRLSDYVELCENPDYKVTLKSPNSSNPTELYADGTNKATDKLESVGPDSTGKTITADFVDGYQLVPGSTITLSFNVKTSAAAKTAGKTAYNGTGDEGTNYSDKDTSAGVDGFYSNTEATVSYVANNREESPIVAKYPHPVVQVSDTQSGGGSEESVVTAELVSHTKTIDALRDNDPNTEAKTNNSDTTLDDDPSTNKTDLYRLYLDATLKTEEQGVDLVIVVDESNSMNKSIEKGKKRDAVVSEVLNGAGSGEGLIQDFLEMNTKNRVAVVGFNGNTGSGGYLEDVELLSRNQDNPDGGWVSGTCDTVTVKAESLGYPYGPGYTNYIAGLMEADRLFSLEQPTPNKKVLVFLSDGVPTIYFDNGDVKEGAKSGGYGGYDSPTVRSSSDYWTRQYYTQYWPIEKGIDVYTIGIIPTYKDSVIDNDSADPALLQWMAGENNYLTAENAETLKNSLREFAMGSYATNLTIEDNLSTDVELHSQPDFKVTMSKTNADGTETVIDLYKNGQRTKDGEGILEGVERSSSDPKRVVAKFYPDYKVQSGWKYTLSFNVQTSAAAKKKFEDNGNTYGGMTGDAETDYPGNDTSSGQPGFRSNQSATVNFTSGGKSHPADYDHPVVQVEGKQPEQTTPGGGGDAVPDATLTVNKKIDAFRDGVNNLNTTLDETATDKTDLYRLYLDAEMSAITNPVDLLIIVDQSGSMNKKDMTDPNEMVEKTEQRQNPNWRPWNDEPMYIEVGTGQYEPKPITRDQAVRLVLNGCYNEGEYETHKQDGLIHQFLAANPENQVAVVSFQGDAYIKSPLEYRYGEDYKYTNSVTDPNATEIVESDRPAGKGKDADTLLTWTDPERFVNVTYQEANATNYCAGLLQGKKTLEKVKGNGHQKVVLFISDGYPTAYIGQTSSGEYYRGGTGNTLQETNLTTYVKSLADVDNPIIHTVSIREKGATDSLGKVKSSNGENFRADSTTDLMNKLKKMITGTCYNNLVIQDKLSEYVDLYSERPDYLVTRKEVDGTITTLWEGSAATLAGEDVIESVAFDSSTKTVTAKFKENYTAIPGTTITLSFNVKTSDDAYDKFANGGYAKGENGTVITGDENTDYDNNNTSSTKKGFRSNYEAKLSFKIEKSGDTQPKDDSLTYPHPVVQVASCDFVLKKTNGGTTALGGAEFDLYCKLSKKEEGAKLGKEIGFAEGSANAGSWYKLVNHVGPTKNNDASGEEGQARVEGLTPGEYCLVETKAPLGYMMLSEPKTFTLKQGTNFHGEIVGSNETIEIGGEQWPLLTVVNEGGVELPMTGGSGVGLYLAAGTLLMACAAVGLAAKRRRGARV